MVICLAGRWRRDLARRVRRRGCLLPLVLLRLLRQSALPGVRTHAGGADRPRRAGPGPGARARSGVGRRQGASPWRRDAARARGRRGVTGARARERERERAQARAARPFFPPWRRPRTRPTGPAGLWAAWPNGNRPMQQKGPGGGSGEGGAKAGWGGVR